MLNYLYAISSDKDRYSISQACDLSTSEYGLLTGYGFSATFVITGLFVVRAADKYNRRNIICLGALIWNCALAGMGTASSFWELLVYRLLLGFGQAFSNPASYSCIADLFPPRAAPKANGIFASGVYIGGALASISEKAGEEIGWRWTMYMCAIIGGSVAVIMFLSVSEPTRKGKALPTVPQPPSSSDKAAQQQGNEGQGYQQQGGSGAGSAKQLIIADDQTPTIWQTISFLFTDGHTATLLAAASVRFMGGYAIAGYLPTFYTLKFSQYTSQYSLINAFVVGGGGFVSSLAGGYLTTFWLSKPDSWGSAKANYYVPALGALSGIPFICLCLLSPNFYVSLCVGLLFEYLTAECWFGPYMSALQGGVPKTMRATAVSVMLFLATFFGSLASYIIGVLQDAWRSDAYSIKVILLASITSSYAISAWLFVLASNLTPRVGGADDDDDGNAKSRKPAEASERSALLSGNGQAGDDDEVV